MPGTSCLVTVVGSARRLDLALPADVAVSELLGELLPMLAEDTPEPPPSWGLVRLGGRRLDGELGLAEQGVADGSLLFLRDLAEPEPPVQIDDYAEAVAVAVDVQPGRWNRGAGEALMVGLAAAWIAGASLVQLRLGAADRPVVAGLAAVALVVTVAAGALARLPGRRLSGALLGLGALPPWTVAAVGLAELQRLSPLETLAAALAVLCLGSLLNVLAGGEAALGPSLGVLTAALPAALVATVAAVDGLGLLAAAALLAPLTLALLRPLPRLAARLAGLQAAAAPGLGRRLALGRRLLAAAVAGDAAAAVAAGVVLALGGSWFGRALVVALATSVALQARHFRFTAEVAPLLLAGLGGLAALEYALVLPLAAERIGRLAVAPIVLLTAAAVALAGLTRGGVDPEPGPPSRLLDRLDVLATAATVPLALGVLGLYQVIPPLVRQLAG